jgi:ankyrin repeat protein
MEFIANNGADLLATDASGQTALHQVARTKDEPALRLLVKRGGWVSLDVPDSNGDTPRTLAEGENSEGFVEAMQKASDAVESKKAQESRMAAGKVFFDATRQLAEGKIADAVSALESGLVRRPLNKCQD